MTDTFGFRATYDTDPDQPGWKIHLPHQCDRWTISADSDYDSPVPQAEAIARLTQFIAEAEALLIEIRQASAEPTSDLAFGAKERW